MERNVGQESTTNIRPIPPQLEFPFPRISDELSTSPATTLPTTNTSPQGIGPSPDEKGTTQLKDRLSETQGVLADTSLSFESPRPSSNPVIGGVKKPPKNPLDPFAEPLGPSKTASNPSYGREPSRPSKSRSKTSRLGNRTIRPKGDSGLPTAKQSSHADQYGRFSVGNENYKTKGKVNKTSGRLDISLNETANRGYLAKALGASLNHHRLLPKAPHNDEEHLEQQPNKQPSGLRRPDLAAKLSSSLGVSSLDKFSSTPVLNIVIMVIGSRGDIQPFLKIGKLLKEEYGHNVRIATHPAFKKFVEEDCGLSFFSVGGDPAELMAFMVKNPGLIPSVATVRAGEIGRRRDAMFEMFQGFWRACINATDDETGISNRRMVCENPRSSSLSQ